MEVLTQTEQARRRELNADSRAALALGLSLDEYRERRDVEVEAWCQFLRSEMDRLGADDPVTAPGRTISSRLAAATLTAAGLTDFIASDHQHYVELVVEKASDLTSLANLRMTLRDRIANTEFGNSGRYARAVERQYRSMWRKWCNTR
jgi:hypothetical protein